MHVQNHHHHHAGARSTHAVPNASRASTKAAHGINAQPSTHTDNEMKFIMTETIEVPVSPDDEVDAEGESDYEEGDEETEVPSSDTVPESEAAQQEPEQKVYIRFKNLQNNMTNKKRSRPDVETTSEGSHPSKRSRVGEDVELPSSPFPTTPLPSKKQTNARSKQKAPPAAETSSPQTRKEPSPDQPVTPDKLADIPREAKQLFAHLVGQDFKALPDIEDAGEDQPWTAERLFHLYIVSLSEGATDLCDLIVDVWIRAFQKHDRFVARECNRMKIDRDDLDEEDLVWRENTFHPDRKKFRDVGMPPSAEWQKRAALALPTLAGDVAAFNPELLNQLYEHTPKNNGARKFWADSLALCGDKAQDWLLKLRKKNIDLHPDLIFNVLCTALRMTRRKLTLKIEELGENTWCRRYHAHGEHKKCYRAGVTDEPKSPTTSVPASAPTYTFDQNEGTTYAQERGRHVHFAPGQAKDSAIELSSEDESSEEE